MIIITHNNTKHFMIHHHHSMDVDPSQRCGHSFLSPAIQHEASCGRSTESILRLWVAYGKDIQWGNPMISYITIGHIIPGIPNIPSGYFT